MEEEQKGNKYIFFLILKPTIYGKHYLVDKNNIIKIFY